MTTKEILIAARKKIERPECWTKGALARNAAGTELIIGRESAVCWCAFGATEAANAGNNDHEASDAERSADNALRSLVPNRDVPSFNDAATTTHADILALFDRAIAACETP